MRETRPNAGLLAFVALLLVGCGALGKEHLGPLEIELRYHGSSEGTPVEAFILHTKLNNYDEGDNLLDAPLEQNDATRLTEIPSGQWYLTVIRKQRPLPDSPRVALTTSEPVRLDSGRYEILVFDDFFRILDPVPSEDATFF